MTTPKVLLQELHDTVAAMPSTGDVLEDADTVASLELLRRVLKTNDVHAMAVYCAALQHAVDYYAANPGQ